MGQQCKFLICDASKESVAPSSEFHMELGVAFERFRKNAEDALKRLADSYQNSSHTLSRSTAKMRVLEGEYFYKGDGRLSNDSLDESDRLDKLFGSYQYVGHTEFRVWVEYGEESFFIRDDGEDVIFCCGEEMIILTLLHCCKESATAVRKINYKGAVYTDIKFLEFLDDVVAYKDTTDTKCIQRPVRFVAKRGGSYMLVYFFGDADAFADEFAYSGEAHFIWTLSYGVVEVRKNQIYVGAYHYRCRDYIYTQEGENYWRNIVDDDTALHVFLETDGYDVTFSVLINGKLYKKISKDNESVIFYDTPFYGKKLHSPQFKQGENPGDIIFKYTNGEYLYQNKGVGENRFEAAVFTPPEMPDLDRFDSYLEEDLDVDLGSMGLDFAGRLFEDYIGALYDAFSFVEEYKTELGVFKRVAGAGGAFRAETDDFVLIGKYKYEPVFDVKNLEEKYDVLENPDDNIRIVIVGALFTEDGITVALIPSDGLRLAIEAKDSKQTILYREEFSELRKRSIFSHADLPETLRFDPRVGKFVENIEIYKRIKAAILSYGIKKFISSLSMARLESEEMKKILYDDGMTPDKAIIDFAVAMKNKFSRTDIIPNIALIGEAGTGKSSIVRKLGANVFGKEVMSLSPSDLKGAYIGHTAYVVVEKLAEAAINHQIIFIDEAYELMADKFGREAVSLLLPLMTGDRKKIDANLDKGSIKIDFEQGIIEKDNKTKKVTPGVPPIWIGGYEDDVRLMISQNQGLFRRLQRIEMKRPTTAELLHELKKRLKGTLDELEGREEAKQSGHSSINKKAKEKIREKMRYKINTLNEWLEDDENEKLVTKFFRWGTQPQNSRYFANYAGVGRFFDRCVDGIDFVPNLPKDDITRQIKEIMDDIKRDIRHQLDTVRRKGYNNGINQYEDSERIEMISDNDTRFSDLIGCDSQIEYMKKIINMFASKDDYMEQNITVPKGVLLLGMPGVGKTFIARAMAGELQQKFEEEAPNKRVGFMALSAPELTAKPIRFIGSIFDKAEEYDVCVIFIDEVDAIAKRRYQNEYYSHFIELIKQMDGIEQRSNVFILAATNAYESLDPAFTRSGRIDKELFFTLPDSDARCKLAEISIRKRKNGRALTNVLPEEFEKHLPMLTKEIAEITRGYTPGDIENIINTAFIMYDQKPDISGGIGPKFGNAKLEYLYSLIYEAVERNDIGELHRAKKEEAFSVDKNDQSCSSVAVHEVGHALSGILCGREPFEKITSLPRGDALGYVMPARNKLLTKKDYENCIRTTMGGRIAEEIVYGKENISVGAFGDMKKATYFARRMVEELGFSDEFEFMTVTEETSQHLGASGYNCSESFREQSDKAVNELLKRLYQETREMLADKKELIVMLAEQVFQRETMSGKDFYKLYEKQTQNGLVKNKS